VSRARRVVLLAAVASTCALAAVLVACVDGQTPDCSDAAAGCGPDNDGSVPVDTGAETSADSGVDADTGVGDAPVDSPKDAPVDAPADAGDAGDAKAG
jgi:hypothetical protein